MSDIGTEQLIIGHLMRDPSLLLQQDKYQINTEDFSSVAYQYIYYAIHKIVQRGEVTSISVIDIENYFGEGTSSRSLYNSVSGRGALTDAVQKARDLESSFESAYVDFKRYNLIKDLKKAKFLDSRPVDSDRDTNPGIGPNEEMAIQDFLEGKSASEVLSDYERELIELKGKYMKGDSSASQTVFDGLAELMEELQEYPEVGIPFQGELFNHIVGGGLPRRLYLRSGSSGLGKTRQAFADAMYMAVPIRYCPKREEWVQEGYSEKVLFILTEQEFDEVQKMAIAYLTGVNESVYKRGLASDKQLHLMRQAIKVFETFKENLHLARVPNPSTAVIEQIIREHVLRNGVRYVYYDYIFESPSLYNEFKGMNLRTDQMLFNFSDVLKKLAVDLDIFIMSGTQVNAKSDSSKDIRNEAALAGARAVINKADVGCIMARPTNEELTAVRDLCMSGEEPNVVTDIYKVRGGEFTQVRVWSYVDLGTLRKKDLFVTDSNLRAVNISYENMSFYQDEGDMELIEKVRKELNGDVR